MKNSTKTILGILVLVVLVGIGWAAAHKQSDNTGTLYVGVTDATENIINVNEIDLSVDKVEVWNETEGWIAVSSNSETYPLLALQASGKTKLYAKENVAAGAYSKARVTLGQASVRTENNGDIEAVMPAQTIMIDTNLKVEDNKNTHLTLDFKGDKSLHATASGKLVFAPVVEAKAESGVKVAVAGDDTVTVSGGTVDSNSSVGVDLDGSSKANFALTTNNTLEVKSVVGDVITFSLNGKEIISDGSSDEEENESLKIEGEGEGNLENDMIDSKEESSGSGAGIQTEGGVKLKAY